MAVMWLMSRYISTLPTTTGRAVSVHIQSLVGMKSASYFCATARSTARRPGRTALSRDDMQLLTLDRLLARQLGMSAYGVALSPSKMRCVVSGRTFDTVRSMPSCHTTSGSRPAAEPTCL